MNITNFSFGPESSIAVQESQQQFNNLQMKVDLRSIQVNYSKLQDSSLCLTAAFGTVAVQNLEDASGVNTVTKCKVLLYKNLNVIQHHIKKDLSKENPASNFQYFSW